MDVNRDHVISIELSAEEWRAFVQVAPQPVSWLRERIHESIVQARDGRESTDAEAVTV